MSVRRHVWSFFVDIFVSALASLVSALVLRFYVSAFPEFSNYLAIWTAAGLICAIPAVLIAGTNKIIYAHASFKSVSKVILCSTIKAALLAVFFFALWSQDKIAPWILLVTDFMFNNLCLICYKISIILYQEGAFSLENEEAESRKMRVLVYGTGSKSISTVTRYESSSHYMVLGLLTRNPRMAGSIVMDRSIYYLPEGGSIDDLPVKDVEAILFVNEDDRMKESAGLVGQCLDKGICVLTIPTVQSTNYPGLDVSEVKHLLENRFIPDSMSMMGRALKRTFDFVVSAILIVVFSPLMLLIYAVLRINEGKPVLYRQERIGRFGRPFTILKFRTMTLDAESDGPALFAGDDDPRLTKTGKFLRDHHLDELPQLFNVFRGDMSFVGYRPERKVYIDQIVERDPRYAYLYQMRPGVTSYATLRNGYAGDIDKMLKRLSLDLYYLNHRSIMTDCRVLWDTFANIVLGKKF